MPKSTFPLIFLLIFTSLCSPLLAQNYPSSQYLISQELPQLPSLMPRNTVLALGIQEGAALAQEFPELITQWQELELLDALFAVSGIEEGDSQVEAIRDNLMEFGLLNNEAWLVVSAANYNPLPAVLLLAKIGAEQQATVLELVASADTSDSFDEGGLTFYELDNNGEDATFFMAFIDDILMLSTNPDVLRGSLRQLAESDSEASFVASEGYQQSLATINEPAHIYSYIDYAQASRILRPYTQGFGVKDLVERVASSVETLGISVGYARLENSAAGRSWKSYGMQILDADADAAFYNLMLPEANLELDTLRFMPSDALSYNHNSVDLAAWWLYLDAIADTVPFFEGGLDDTIELFLTVSPKDDLLSWMGAQLTTIVLEPAEVTTPGVAAQNLLGETVYIVPVRNQRAANNRLPKFLSSLASNLAMFTDPLGRGDVKNSQDVTIAGVEGHIYEISEGITIAYAFVDEQLLLATSQEALERVLLAAQGNNLAAQLDTRGLPASSTAFAYNDAVANMRSTSEQIASQLQTMAGITGSENLDVDSIEEATARLQQFFDTLAEHLGDNTSYSYVENGILYHVTETVLTETALR